MRIAIYAIAQNELRHAVRFVQSCAGADLILVADTGSTDGTPQAFRDLGVQVFQIAVRPWRFDVARNTSLSLVPADTDICIALDIDEVLSPGWRDALERAWTSETTMGRYRYVTSHLANGAPATEMKGAKIHRRFGYRWRHLCHEILVPDRLAAPKDTWIPDLEVHHWPDSGKSRAHYVELLEAAVKEDTGLGRDLFMLGGQYLFAQRWADAERVLNRYLEVAGHSWPVQRAAALRRIARAQIRRNMDEPARANLGDSLALAPKMRDSWLDLADLHARLGEWRESLDAARRALDLPLTTGGIANDPLHAGGRPFYRASLAALELGLTGEALDLARAACAREPDQAHFADHLRRLEEA